MSEINKDASMGRDFNLTVQSQQWRMLLIYNIYRFLCIITFIGAGWFEIIRPSSLNTYFFSLSCFFIYGCIFLLFCVKRYFSFFQQVFWSGTIDIIVTVLMLNAVSAVDSGLGILLYVLVAMLSILIPGKMAIYFASIACSMLLITSTLNYLKISTGSFNYFYSIAMYGAGFFATSITALYLANRVKTSELYAERRGKELENIRHLSRYIVEQVRFGVIYLDRLSQIKIINTAAFQLLKVRESKEIKHLQELSRPLNQKYELFREQLHAFHESHTAQAMLPELYLQIYFYSAKSTAKENGEVLIILNDMADIAQQAQQMKLASLGFFSASIAHELRNPLGAISHAAQLLGDEGRFDAESERLKQMILNNCERMNKIIKNVLELSRGKKASSEEIILSSFLKEFKKEYTAINHCSIDLVLPSNEHKVIFDKTHLQQILVILCDNVLQHGKNIETRQAEITIQLTHGIRNLELSISDTGPGISETDAGHIFDPFFSTESAGNGMGLFIAKDLCEVNQAQLNLAQFKGGSTFMLNINHANEIKI